MKKKKTVPNNKKRESNNENFSWERWKKLTRAIFEWNSVCEGLLPLTVYVDRHRLLGGCAFINPGCFLGTGGGWR